MVGLLAGTSGLEGVRAEGVRAGGREGMSELRGLDNSLLRLYSTQTPHTVTETHDTRTYSYI